MGAWSPVNLSIDVKRPSITHTSWSGLTKTDGCGIFYSKEKFQLVMQHSVNFLDPHDRVGLIVLLQRLVPEGEAPRYLLVANTHLYWDIRKEEVQLAELQHLHTEVEALLLRAETELGTERSSIPVIVAGDFNNVPNSSVYRYMLESFLPDTHSMRSAYSDYRRPPGQVDSELEGAYEPPVTSVTYRRAHTIDYIWYSAGLQTTFLHPLPSEEALRSEDGPPHWKEKVVDTQIQWEDSCNYNGLPNSQWGSDHIPLMASFTTALASPRSVE